MPDINENEELWPWEYTNVEGGSFIFWQGTSITKQQLAKLVAKADTNLLPFTYVMIDGYGIHSLIFESAAVGNPNDGMYARWDCLNGWTTTIEEAKKNFPKGLHGQLPTWRVFV